MLAENHGKLFCLGHHLIIAEMAKKRIVQPFKKIASFLIPPLPLSSGKYAKQT